MEDCVSEVKWWMSENKLQLNDGKMEAMLVGSRRASIASSVPTLLCVGLSDIKFTSQVKNLGITIHCYLTNVCASAFVELRCIAFIGQYLSCDGTKMLISAFVFSKLDYRNSLLAGAPRNLVVKLKRVQNTAARLVVRCHRQHHITPVL